MRVLAIVFASVLAAAPLTAAQTRGAKPAAGKTPAGEVRTVDVIGTDDMKYSVTTITAKRGETLRIRLMSRGTMPKVVMAHNVVVLKLGTNAGKFATDGAPHRQTDFIPPAMASAVLAKTAFAGPGETVQVTFPVPQKPGSYPFVCTFPGHFQAGMKGTLIVK